jgi:hypothetical protein
MADELFDTVVRWQGGRPWGCVLDAGTGEHSLNWICGLPQEGWTAITGDPVRATRMTEAREGRMRPTDRILAGNWTDPMLLQGERFETVLADYLLGAVDGFAPYFQDQLFARLRPHVAGRLYIIGLAPYPDQATTPGGRLILEIARLRDACILLAAHRCYREYPLDWVLRHLEGSGYRVLEARSIPILYRERFINGQLDVCRSKLPYMADRGLAAQMERHIEELRARALGLAELREGIRFGEDYVVAAEPVG